VRRRTAEPARHPRRRGVGTPTRSALGGIGARPRPAVPTLTRGQALCTVQLAQQVGVAGLVIARRAAVRAEL